MDQEVFRQLAKFTVSARKATGKKIDVARIASDPAYACAVFDLVESGNDEELIFLALSLRSALGLLVQAKSKPKPTEVSDTQPPKDSQTKYKFGARGG
jgi:hypothetical protein